jgi:hypothetical protein
MNMNIRIAHDVRGITGTVSAGRNEALVTKTVERDGSSQPCYLMFAGSGSRTTPKDALERARLIAKAAEIGAILDEIEEFPRRLNSFFGWVSLELAERGLEIAVPADVGPEQTFDMVQSLLLILSKATSLPAETLLGKMDADSWDKLRATISHEKFQNLAESVSGPGLAELL